MDFDELDAILDDVARKPAKASPRLKSAIGLGVNTIDIHDPVQGLPEAYNSSFGRAVKRQCKDCGTVWSYIKLGDKPLHEYDLECYRCKQLHK